MKKHPLWLLSNLCVASTEKLSAMIPLVLFLVLSVFHAKPVYSQQTFSLSYENVRVRDVLNEIERSSEYKFLYRSDLIDLNRRVNLSAQNSEVGELLAMIFPNESSTFKVFEDNLIAITGSANAIQQNVVTGQVRDANTGESLPGVNIAIGGTMIGTVTDVDGRFSLTVDGADAVLVFSYIGYVTRRVPVAGQSIINVALSLDLAQLDEVVVVGYGTQRRREVTSSIATVREEDFNKGAITQSPLQLVQGKIAGLAISRSSGGDPNVGIQM